MDKVIDRLYSVAQKQIPDNAGVLSVVGFGGTTNAGFARVFLKDPDQRSYTQQQIAAKMSVVVKGITEGRVVVTQDETIQTGGSHLGLPVQFVIEAPNMDSLASALPRFEAVARQDKTFGDRGRKPEVHPAPAQDRRGPGSAEKPERVLLQCVAGTPARSGRVAHGVLPQQGQPPVPDLGQLPDAYRGSPSDINAIQVRSDNGQFIPLGNLITYKERAAPPQLFHYNRFVSATVSATLAPGMAMGDGIAAMRRAAAKTLSPNFTTELAGPARDYAESSSSLIFVLLLALVLIYLVLAAQFESFRDPVIILLTVPLSMFGALLSLVVFHQTLNIFSEIGLVMLIGLVTKNGILIVEFTRQNVEKGLLIEQAVMEAAEARLRPILMTTLTAALGMLPIAWATGTGAESRRPMGIAVVGGLIFGMVLTLFVIPTMVLLFHPKGKGKHAAKAEAPAHG